MTNIYSKYCSLNREQMKICRSLFFTEFQVSEQMLQKVLKSQKPAYKYIKFFSLLFELNENLSPFVMNVQLSKDYLPLSTYKLSDIEIATNKEAVEVANKLLKKPSSIIKKNNAGTETMSRNKKRLEEVENYRNRTYKP